MTHQEEGAGDPPRRGLIVELKDDTPPPLAQASSVKPAFPRDGAKKLLENARVVVWDYQFPPGKPVAQHVHDKDSVLVVLEWGRLRLYPEKGEPETIVWTADAASARARAARLSRRGAHARRER